MPFWENTILPPKDTVDHYWWNATMHVTNKMTEQQSNRGLERKHRGLFLLALELSRTPFQNVQFLFVSDSSMSHFWNVITMNMGLIAAFIC